MRECILYTNAGAKREVRGSRNAFRAQPFTLDSRSSILVPFFNPLKGEQAMTVKEFHYQDPFPLGKDETKYRLLTKDGVSVTTFEGKDVLKIDPPALTFLANQAMRDVSFLLRPEHNEMVAKILTDPEASMNDKGVAIAMLRNAEVSAKFELPVCQDTGTGTIMGKKGQQVWTGVNDEEYLSKGVHKTYTEENLRYSQTLAL